MADEPRPLFPSEPSGVGAAGRTAPERPVPRHSPEPGPLFAPDAAPSGSASPSPPQKPADTSGPRALAFPDTPPKPAAKPTGLPLFQDVVHGAQGASEDAARAHDPALFDAESVRVRRCIGKLLPVTLDRVAAFADNPLRSTREQVLASAELVSRFSGLRAAERLEDALRAVGNQGGVLGRLKSRLAPGPGIPELEVIARALQDLAAEVAAASVEATDSELRLAVHLLALRGVERVLGNAVDTAVPDAVAQRLSLLLAAVTQARLLAAQLQQLRITLTNLVAEYERVLTVTLSASALANAPRPG